jgi:hypothetical protein
MMWPLILLVICALSFLVLVSLRPMLQVAVAPDFHEQTDPIKIKKSLLTTSASQHRRPRQRKKTAVKAVNVPEEKHSPGYTDGRTPPYTKHHHKLCLRPSRLAFYRQRDLHPFPWQKRAPHAILLSTMKGGTQAVTNYLWQYPKNIVRNYRDKKELHFEDFDEFQRNESGIPQRQNQIAYAEQFAVGYPDLFFRPSSTYCQRRDVRH